MTNKIQIYTDETKANDNSFVIYSMIYGEPEHISALNEDLKKNIHPPEETKKDFKGLHANKVNDSNWKTLGKKCEDSLDKLIEYVQQDKIGFKFLLIASKKDDNNIGVLKSLFKKELDKEGSSIKKQYESLDKKDHPAIYHRLDQLILYFIYRDELGSEETKFEFYPDSTGNILNYKEKEFRATGSDNQSADLKFYEYVQVFGNTVAKAIGESNFPGWSKSKQELVKYEALKWSDSYMIQLCDIIVNFFYNHIRFLAGKSEKKYELKSNALTSRIGLDKLESKIKVAFEIKNNDVSCVVDYTLMSFGISKE